MCLDGPAEFWGPVRSACGSIYSRKHGAQASSSLPVQSRKPPTPSTRHLSCSSFLVLFSSQGKLVIGQIHPAKQFQESEICQQAWITVFLPCSLERLRLHTGSGVTAPEVRGAARREGECPVTVCSRLWLWRQSHLLWIICSLTSDPERFLESVQCGDSTDNRMSKPVRNSARKGKQISFCPGSPSLSISFSLSL